MSNSCHCQIYKTNIQSDSLEFTRTSKQKHGFDRSFDHQAIRIISKNLKISKEVNKLLGIPLICSKVNIFTLVQMNNHQDLALIQFVLYNLYVINCTVQQLRLTPLCPSKIGSKTVHQTLNLIIGGESKGPNLELE